MGRRDAEGRTDVEKFRKNIGRFWLDRKVSMIVDTSMYPAFIRPYSRSDNLTSVAITGE